MNYCKLYFSIIRTALLRENKTVTCERHHIVPKSIGGINDSINLVNLTTREHYLCHMLLVRIFKNHSHRNKMSYALWWMSKSRNGKNDKIVTSRQYETSKIAAIEAYRTDENRINKIKQAHRDGRYDNARKKTSDTMKFKLGLLSDIEMKHRMSNSTGKADHNNRINSIKKGKSTECLLIKPNGEQITFFSYDDVLSLTGFKFDAIRYRLKKHNGILLNGSKVIVIRRYQGNDKNIGRKRNNGL